ncbi:hypothetical protein GCM10010994_53530 [Chelatococcus reniformis]|uniref:Acyltransferase MbtK/IucB-like conserved domain-containing protein n=2 Tax=Chelatococcus reniformis TaxID=1494448 RepID=A0A916UUY9_9HYPH|nr:hypothetical protein GCM10010994_53530 [Chelatococcus reniformis]
MTAPTKISTAAADGRSLHMLGRAGETLAVVGTARDDGSLQLCVLRGSDVIAEASLRAGPTEGDALLELTRPDGAHPADAEIVAALAEAAFQRVTHAERLLLPGWTGRPALAGLSAETWIEPGTERPHAVVLRHEFYQLPLLWRHQAAHAAYPLVRSRIGPEGRLPPLRPAQPSGLMYQRWVPHLDGTLSLRAIDRRRDLKLFHGWMNQPRVAFFWELAQSEAELDRYLADQEADPHLFGVIGSFNDEPVGYFEFYWALEDRLGPHYDAEDFDRGWHGLIGNARHLGRPKTLAWFRSLTHYLFLDEPRTRRIVGEPRASHHKMLSYCADVAYDKVKEFDFPHKRAALVCCERERFFREVVL